MLGCGVRRSNRRIQVYQILSDLNRGEAIKRSNFVRTFDVLAPDRAELFTVDPGMSDCNAAAMLYIRTTSLGVLSLKFLRSISERDEPANAGYAASFIS